MGCQTILPDSLDAATSHLFGSAGRRRLKFVPVPFGSHHSGLLVPVHPFHKVRNLVCQNMPENVRILNPDGRVEQMRL
jgi:hypothetical protein